MKSSQTTKSSGKARMKALVAKDMSKRKGQHHRNSTQTTRSQLLRTESIHRSQYLDRDPLADIILDDESPCLHQNNENSSHINTKNVMLVSDPGEAIPSNQKCEACSTSGGLNSSEHGKIDNYGKKLVDCQTFLQESTDKPTGALSEQNFLFTEELPEVPPSKEFLDALRVISMNREFFLKILQDPESPWAYHFHYQQAGRTKSRLSKSGSFPGPGASREGDFMPIELKYNQKEITFHARSEGKLQVDSQTQNLAEFESTEYVSEQSKSGVANNSSLGLPNQLKRRSESRMAIKHFKDLKQKIKHAIRQSKKERRRITMDAIFHTVPHGYRFSKDAKKPISDQWKEPATSRNSGDCPGSSYGWGNSAPDLGKQTLFPNNSLERYTRLFESSFNKEGKCQISERLKLRTEDAGLPSGSVPKSLRRILSLPDSKSYFSLQSEDYFDNYLSEMPVKTVKDSTVRIQRNYDEPKSLEFPLGSEDQFDAIGQSQKHWVEASEAYPVKQDQVRPEIETDGEVSGVGWTNYDSCDLMTQDTTFNQGQGIRTTIKSNANMSEPSSISILDSNAQDDFKFQDMAHPGKLPVSEGLFLSNCFFLLFPRNPCTLYHFHVCILMIIVW